MKNLLKNSTQPQAIQDVDEVVSSGFPRVLLKSYIYINFKVIKSLKLYKKVLSHFDHKQFF